MSTAACASPDLPSILRRLEAIEAENARLRANLDRYHRPRHRDRDAELSRLHADGLSYKKLARRFDMTPSAVRQAVRRYRRRCDIGQCASPSHSDPAQ